MITVELPTLHADQVNAFWVTQQNRFSVVRAGRRWGKTDLGKTLACDMAIKGWPVGWFAPDYKISAEAFTEISNTLEPVLKSSSKVEGVQRTITGGRIDFWTLDNERAGRSRKYKLILIDEAAFTKPNMMSIWEKSIKPTLLDYTGSAVVLSNTNGIDAENFMWRICNEEKHGFVGYHAPTHKNPYLPAEELAKLINDNHPLVYQQEYLAEFVDWSGAAFFERDKLLAQGQPVPWPSICDSVFAIIDSASKTGKEHDGTGVTYFARSSIGGYPLTVLDYDLVQIEGALLESWLPTVLANLEKYGQQCRARYGSLGVWIEDQNSGVILLQQAARKGWAAQPIDSKLTSLGKDERAINASGPVYRGEVKISQQAYDRIVTFKGTSKNHLLDQVFSFRVGDKDAAKRADDLLDTFTYGVEIGLGVTI